MHGRGPFRTLLDPSTVALASSIGFDTEDAGAAGGSAGGTDTGKAADTSTDTDDDNGGLGFPAKTPWRDMTAEQQAAYWRHQSKTHESRAKENATAAKERDDLKKQHQTESEKAIEAAKATGRAEAMREVVEARLVGALAGRMDEEAAEEMASSLNHTKFLDDSGKVDTAKIREWVEKVAPKKNDAGGGTSRQKVDAGGGKTAATATKPSVQSGMDRYAERHAPRGKSSVTAA